MKISRLLVSGWALAILFGKFDLVNGVSRELQPFVPIIPWVIGAVIGCSALNIALKYFMAHTPSDY
jgi:hypothetical protein